tara:strand:+ start:4695 stop:4946 length:252 start_codon:yes stop_codon:yes gene_type:complete
MKLDSVQKQEALLDIVMLCGPAFLDMLEDITNNANVHELLEWAFPEINDLPGSDEDEDQTEYISHLESFEGLLSEAALKWHKE